MSKYLSCNSPKNSRLPPKQAVKYLGTSGKILFFHLIPVFTQRPYHLTNFDVSNEGPSQEICKDKNDNTGAKVEIV